MEVLLAIAFFGFALHWAQKAVPGPIRPLVKLLTNIALFPLIAIKAMIWDSPKNAKGALFAVIFLLFLTAGVISLIAIGPVLIIVGPIALFALLLHWYRKRYISGRSLHRLPRRRR